MNASAALFFSLASLTLISAIYYCNILSGPRSWLRSEMLAMVLLSLLTGLFPLAVAAPGFLAWTLLTEGAGTSTLGTFAVGVVSIAALVASILVFRALVIATYRSPDVSTPRRPRSPKANGWQAPHREHPRKAA